MAEAPGSWDPHLTRRHLYGTVFYGACLLAIAILLMTLLLLLYDVLSQGLPWLSPQFMTGVPSRRPERAGIFPALIGSIEITLLVGLIAVPLGIAAAIYLAEYAGNSRLTNALRTNISNLAGVPSVIYGIFGLALFVRFAGLGFTILSPAR